MSDLKKPSAPSSEPSDLESYAFRPIKPLTRASMEAFDEAVKAVHVRSLKVNTGRVGIAKAIAAKEAIESPTAAVSSPPMGTIDPVSERYSNEIDEADLNILREFDVDETNDDLGAFIKPRPKMAPKAMPAPPWGQSARSMKDVAAALAVADPTSANQYEEMVASMNQILAGAPVGQPIITATQTPKADQPKKGPSLRAFVNTDVEFESSDWSYDKIMEGIAAENWRMREVDEVMKEGDLIHRLGDTPGAYVVERVQGLKDQILTQDYLDHHELAVYTLDGGGKKKAPPHGKVTADFKSIYEVPSTLGSVNGTKDKLELPTDEAEAKRFFGVDVMVAEQTRKGKHVKVFFPSIPTLKDRKLRAAFSRVFAEFARKHLRDSLKGIIVGRGDGIHLKRGCSPKHILKATQSMVGPFHLTERPTLHSVCNLMQAQIERETDAAKRKVLKAKLSLYQNMDEDLIDSVLSRHDYRPKGAAVRPAEAFVKRMENRKLIPTEFRYDKAIGIEIETLCPLGLTADQNEKLSQSLNTSMGMGERILTPILATRAFIDSHGGLTCPSFVRAAIDCSIKGDNNASTSTGGNDGKWGVEWRMLIKRSEMESRLAKAMDYLNGLGCSVNKTCGLHIHFDMRDKNEDEVAALCDKLVKWLKVLIELIPEKRRDNQYCKLENYEKPHWAGVSMDAFKKHSTLEIRVHSGTTSQIKLIRWIALLETLISMTFAPPANMKISTLDGLKMLPLSEAERTYWLKRHQHLNKELYRIKDATLPKELKTPKLDMSFLDKPDEIE